MSEKKREEAEERWIGREIHRKSQTEKIESEKWREKAGGGGGGEFFSAISFLSYSCPILV